MVQNLLTEPVIDRKNNLELRLSLLLGDKEPLIGEPYRYKWKLEVAGNNRYNRLEQLEVQFALSNSEDEYYIITDYKPKESIYNYESSKHLDTRAKASISPTGPSFGIDSKMPTIFRSKELKDRLSFKHEKLELIYDNWPLNSLDNSLPFEGEVEIVFFDKSKLANFKIEMTIISSFCRKKMRCIKDASRNNPRIDLDQVANACIEISPKKSNSSNEKVENPAIKIAHGIGKEWIGIAKQLKDKYNTEINPINILSSDKFIIKDLIEDSNILVLILTEEDINTSASCDIRLK